MKRKNSRLSKVTFSGLGVLLLTFVFLIVAPNVYGQSTGNTGSNTGVIQGSDTNFEKKEHSGIFTCDGGAKTIVDETGIVWEKSKKEGKKYSLESGLPICTFNELLRQVDYIINFIFQLIIPIVFILILYAGWLFISGKGGDRDKAKNMLWSIVKGIFFMAIAFVLVKLILEGLETSDEYNFLLNMFGK